MSDNYKLTNSDCADLLASLYPGADKWTQNAAIVKAQTAVGEFVDPRWRGASPYVDWTVRVLFDLSDTQFDYDTHGPFESIEQLRSVFEMVVKAVWDDHLERLVDEPEYREYRIRCNSSADDHPWDNDCIDDCRRWLAETPYVVWKIAHDVEEWAADAARDEAAAWCTDGFRGDGKDVIRTVQKRYEGHIKRLQTVYREAREREAAEKAEAEKAQMAQEWDLSPLA